MLQKNGSFLLWSALLFSAFAGLLRWPAEAAQAVRDGLSLCAGTILPALFPFFILSTLTVESGLAARLGRPLERCMNVLFRVNGSCAAALVLGLIGGYPVGAKAAADLYRNGRCNESEARRLLGFCNNAGPSFLIGVVGAGIFQSAKLGLLLEGIHIFSALLIGLLYHFLPDTRSTHEKAVEPPSSIYPVSAAALLPRAVQQSVAAFDERLWIYYTLWSTAEAAQLLRTAAHCRPGPERTAPAVRRERTVVHAPAGRNAGTEQRRGRSAIRHLQRADGRFSAWLGRTQRPLPDHERAGRQWTIHPSLSHRKIPARSIVRRINCACSEALASVHRRI